MTPLNRHAEPAECEDCPLHEGRRDFLRHAAAIVASLSLGMLTIDDAHALAPGAPDSRTDERRYPIPAADSVAIDRDNSVIIARAAGRVYAFSLACPHQNTALRWDAGDGEFRCPKHKSRYRPDGTFIAGRATRSMDRLPVRRDGQELVVNLDVAYEQDQQPAAWAAAWVAV